jgi:predicted Rossmann-fold nucleotide-binding protein
MQSSRILVTGSSQLPEEHKGFASDLGARLIAETSSVLVTGGLVSTGEGPLLAVDGLVANAALAAARDDVAARSRIITMLPESDVSGFQRIQAGTVVRVAYSEPRTRRYSMVLTSDAVVGICGGKATREVLDLAYIAGKPLIPVPSTGGASLECWKRYGEELRQRLALTPDEVRALEDERVPSRGVKACLSVLERVVRPRCFVAMSFASHPVANVFETIEGVVEERGYQVVRIDRANFNGNIVDGIWDSIRHCDVAIVDLTEHRPNVYYEMGIAHALNKPTVLIVYSRTGNVPDDIPFDVKVQRILPYGTTQTLRTHLINALPGRGAAAGPRAW